MIGIKDKDNLIFLYQIKKDIRILVYSIFFHLFEKNNNHKDINKKNIKSDFFNLDNLKIKLLKELESLNALLKHINDNNEIYNNNTNINFNNNELYKFNNKNKKNNQIEKFYKEIIKKSDLLNIIFKSSLNINKDLVVRKMVMSDRFRNSFLKLPSQIKFENIRFKLLIEYLQKNLNKNKSQPGPKIECKYEYADTSIVDDNLNITFLSRENDYILLLKLPIFDVLLQLPFDKNCCLNNFVFKVVIIGKEEYENQSIFEEFEYDKKNKKLLLFQKIKNLFELRIISLIQIINEEYKRDNPYNKNNNNSLIYTNEYLIKIAIRFIDYIYDYYRLFKVKCDICGNNAKYNSIERCFFPPYYKLFTNNENILSNKIKNKEKIQNIYVHEECFKKNGLKAI